MNNSVADPGIFKRGACYFTIFGDFTFKKIENLSKIGGGGRVPGAPPLNPPLNM